MVNGVSMENVSSSFAIQTLKTCGRVANIVSVPCGGVGATTPGLSPFRLPCPTHPRVPVQGLEAAVGTCRQKPPAETSAPTTRSSRFPPADTEKTEESSSPCQQEQPRVPHRAPAL